MKIYLISLIRAALNNVKPDKPPKDIDWETIYNLAQKHSVANMVCYAIESLDVEDKPGQEVLGKLMKARQIVIGREMMQQYEVQGMLDAYEKAGIECVALKGWHMKHLYPSTDMRSMCDVDVLIKEADMKHIPDVMNSVGFKFGDHGENHDSYERNSVISVEVHWHLFVESSPYHNYFKNVLDVCEPVEGKKFIKEMRKEDFYLHLLAHAAKHFDGTGTGIRTLTDIWVYNKKYADSFDAEYLEKGLKALGLYEFNNVMKELSNAWFGLNVADAERHVHEEVGNYILSAGAYGFVNNNVVAKLSRENSKVVYLIKRIFPNVQFMSTEFPVLKKSPWLLPGCWIVRGFRCLFVRRHKFVNEIKVIKNSDDDSLKGMINIKKLSGLEK